MSFFKRNYYFTVALLVLMLVLIAWGANYFLLFDNAERGTFGDMFGGLNALFSGFAFVGVIVAILMQSSELKLQREELADTRAVLDGQKEQLEAQSKTLAKQNFENTFFQLVQYNDSVLSRVGTKTNSGKSFVDAILNGFTTLFVSKLGKEFSVDVTSASDFSEHFFEQHSQYMASYFKTILTIFRFIHNADVENKGFYVEVLRSKMSTSEWIILFYYGLNRNAAIREYLEIFRFFNGLNVNYICNPNLLSHYSPNTFHS